LEGGKKILTQMNADGADGRRSRQKAEVGRKKAERGTVHSSYFIVDS
jgi:hypothetical protein